jgi:hypothetical protein
MSKESSTLYHEQSSHLISMCVCHMMTIFYNYYSANNSRDSSVGIATRLRVGRPSNWVRYSVGARDFSLPHNVKKVVSSAHCYLILHGPLIRAL